MNRILLATLLSLALLSGAQAGDRKTAKSGVPTRGVAEDGKEVQKDVATLTGKIAWKTSLDEAKSLAQKEGRMIFWWHVLGDLDGTT